MTQIKILNASLVEQVTINNVLSCARTEKINSDNTLDFTLALDETISALINDTNVIGFGSDYFDIAKYSKQQSGGQYPTVSIECEHISYRLNDATYDVEYFTETGTPTEILTAILAGTDFSVDTVDFAGSETFSLQEATSRRSLLMQFVAYLGGEVEFSGFNVSILTARGSATPKDLTANNNITILSKSVDKRTLDDSGNPTISYECALTEPVAELALGDVVIMEYGLLDIDIELRIVSLTINPYNTLEVSFEVGNYVNSLEDDLYRIETETVSKDKLYNGCRIGPTYGFEAVRSDNKARAYLASDKLALQSGDGTGSTWTDRLYYEYDSELDETVLVFDGQLSATMIEALSAVITPNLYAEKATIAELTVDQLDTSVKVQNYLNEDTSDVKYIKAYEQYIEFIIASTDGASDEQAEDRNGNPLYWTDDTYVAATTEETDYPVMIYVYTEVTKGRMYFDTINEVEVMAIELGAGNDAENPDWGKAKIYKDSDGLKIDYYVSTSGAVRQVKLTDLGIVVTGSVADKGIRNVTVSDTEPSNPENNEFWVDTSA